MFVRYGLTVLFLATNMDITFYIHAVLCVVYCGGRMMEDMMLFMPLHETHIQKHPFMCTMHSEHVTQPKIKIKRGETGM